jgi:pimeloyl-ACP methyl ester carboxylesterase
MSTSKVDQYFAFRKITASQKKYSSGSRTVHYVETGDSTKPSVVFVHGSPGSLSAFIHFLADTSLLKECHLITADRPGFGYSNYGRVETSLEKQAATFEPLLEKLKKNGQPVILVGHSLGGPLIARIAMDYPSLVDKLIIVAGSIAPDLEPKEGWFRAPLATPFLSWTLPRSFRVSNEEIYKLKPELEKMLPHWKDITCPVTVIHGKKDRLVAFANTDFARQQLTNAPVEIRAIDEMDHFVPWSHPQLIREAILKMVGKETELSVMAPEKE